MDRLTDLERLLEVAKSAGDAAEVAKLEGKIAKSGTVVLVAPVVMDDEPTPEPTPKRGKR